MNPSLGSFIDKLRGWAAWVVAAVHTTSILVIPYIGTVHAYTAVSWFARWSVIAFFVISGIVIRHSLDINRSRFGRQFWRRYLSHRAWRILPPLVAALLLCVVLAGILHAMGRDALNPALLDQWKAVERQQFVVTAPQILSTLLGLQAFGFHPVNADGPLWSLGYEMHYYLWAAFGVVVALRLPWLRKAKLPIALVMLIIALTAGPRGGLALYFLIWFAGYCFIDYADRLSILRGRMLEVLCALGILGLLAICWIFHEKEGLPYVFSCLLAGMVIVMLCLRARNDTRAERTGALGAVGKWLAPFSYTLYLIHFPMLLFLFFLLQIPASAVSLYWWIPTVLFAHVCAVLLARVVAGVVENRPLLKSWLLPGKSQAVSRPAGD